MYDIFYVSKTIDNDSDWQKIKSKYPIAQKLSNITSYEEIKSKSFTKMFWVIWDDVVLNDSFNLTEYTATKWDDQYVHVFKNGEHYDGICLFPKNATISKREFYHRFFSEKKEIDVVASIPKQYNIYSPTTYDEYKSITDEMFWLVWPEVEVTDNSIFELYFSHHNAYDRRENHIFKNKCNDTESFMSGVVLCSKYKQLSSREFEKQYVVDKKEYEITASRFKYPQYVLNNYTQYLDIIKDSTQKMFWGIWPEIEVTDELIFNFYFDPNDKTYDFDRNENHVFKHKFNDSEIFVNGVILFSKEKPISQREFNHRFLINRKEHDRLVSQHRLYDVVFISYNEVNADDNYNTLIKKCPRAKRVHGVKGIHQAHIKAAELCDTDMIWIVDGDAVVEDNFNFDLVMSSYDIDCVHVWRSRNPINNLEYGNGGIKLLPRLLTLEMDTNTSDMTTSISKKFKAMDGVSNINSFNTDEFTTWRSAFRECCKLSSRVIERQYEEETQQRLDIWCNVGADKPYGKYAITGASMGRQYGLDNKNNLEALRRINDFEWLKGIFDNVK
jgi:hypothetical protein